MITSLTSLRNPRPFVAGSKALNDFLTWLGCCRIQIHKLCLAAAESNMCIFIISRNMSQGGQKLHGYGSIPINTIFRGMNIHLPAILMFTRGTRF